MMYNMEDFISYLEIEPSKEQIPKMKTWLDSPKYKVENYIGLKKDEIKSTNCKLVYIGEGDVVVEQFPLPDTKIDENVETEQDVTKDGELSGKVVFKLYDTYGFPYELTAEIAEENGLVVNKIEFDEEMKAQKERARAARSNVQSMNSQSKDLMDFEEESKFIGYDHMECEAKVIGLFKDGVRVDELDTYGDVIFDTTCFYAESGGQVGDTGIILCNGETAMVKDVKKAPHGQFLHAVELDTTLKEGDVVSLRVNVARRRAITANHSATHLLQSALKKVAGSHIAQAGSFVCDEYLRFDFTHFEKVNDAQLEEIEYIVNDFIKNKYNVNIEYLAIEEAKKSGATALFDEKYGDIVRVVTMGDVSKEFCGGCHVSNTNEIGLLKIVSEESIGSGIRRITAKTGMAAYNEFKEEEKTLKAASSYLKMKTVVGVDTKVASLVEENNALKKEIERLKTAALMAQADALVNEAKEVEGKKVLIKRMDEVDATSIKEMAISLRDKMSNGVVFLATANNGKVVFAAACDKTLIKAGVHCGNLVKTAAQICEGNGGGKPDLAQAGGKNIDKLNDAMKEISSILGLTL